MNSPSSNNSLGSRGEQIATSFLVKNGYKIIEKNFKIRYGEIDIIVLDPTKKILVFVEVKTRTSDEFGTPFEAITYFKLKSVIKTAQVYKLSHKNLPDAMRIDAIAVTIDGTSDPVVEHLENISGF